MRKRNDTAVKLVLFFSRRRDMDVEEEERYYQFTTTKFFPWLQSHGLAIHEIWLTAYGDAPEQMLGLVAKDIKYLYALLHSQSWHHLIVELMQYIEEYQEVIVPFREGFQIVQPRRKR